MPGHVFDVPDLVKRGVKAIADFEEIDGGRGRLVGTGRVCLHLLNRIAALAPAQRARGRTACKICQRGGESRVEDQSITLTGRGLGER